MTNPNTPVLIGVGQFKHRIDNLEGVIEPVDMMLEACSRAERDTGVEGVLQQVQSVRVVRGMWRYDNPAELIAEQFGVSNAQTMGTLIGGNQNQALMNQTAASILAGELDLVLITGAENGYSSGKARRAGVTLPERDAPGQYDSLFGSAQQPEHHEFEVAKGIRQAIQVYPMYDNAIRHHRGETISEHLVRISELWSRFNDVAQGNPHAWIREIVTAEEIRTPSPTNRRVSFPYTKLMNANNSVDMAAALLVCSVRKAKQLGIAEELWVYPHAGAEGHDHFSASVRDNFYTSPGIRFVGRRVLELAGIEACDLAFVDLYSCFPSAVQVAAMELGLAETDQLTVTGGLTFGGGPINNYVMHAIARMVELLREHPGKRGLITANGGNLYKHAHGVYASEPPERDFCCENVQDEIDALPARECVAQFKGEVSVESYTVMFDANEPVVGHVACLTPDGKRTWANTNDVDVMWAMTQEEFCGRAASIDGEGALTIRS
jgi:acetyl-CoA C-acetyltransferase